jgi:hypothetical protein
VAVATRDRSRPVGFSKGSKHHVAGDNSCILLIIFLLGGFGGRFGGFGNGGISVLGVLLIIVVVLLVTGRI